MDRALERRRAFVSICAEQARLTQRLTRLVREADLSTELANLTLICPHHHRHLDDHLTHTSGTGEKPSFQDRNGRPITPNQPHAPPP